jgi:hypothetical protein
MASTHLHRLPTDFASPRPRTHSMVLTSRPVSCLWSGAARRTVLGRPARLLGSWARQVSKMHPTWGNTSGVCRRRHNGAQPDRLQAMLRQDTRTAARRLCNCLPPGVRQCLIIAIVVPGCMAFKGPACGSQHMSGFTAHSSDKLSWDTIPVFIFSAPRLRACLLWPVPPHVLRAQPWLMHVMQAADQQSLNRSCDSSMSDPTPRDDPRSAT